MSLIKKLAGETAIYGLSSILGRLLNYVIMTPLLTRVFVDGEYGVVSDMYATAAILMVLFTYRMETAFFRFGKEKEDLNRVFSSSSIFLAGTTLALVILLLIFSEPIARLLEYPGKGYYFRYFAIILGADTLSAIPFARLRLINRPLVFAAIRMINIIVNLLLILFFLLYCPYLEESGWPIDWFYDGSDQIKYVFISNLIASLVMWLCLLPSYFRVKIVFDWELVKKMLRYASPLVLAGFAGVINQMVGIPFIKYLGPAEDNMGLVGQYGAAIKIPVLMTLFTQAFNYAAEPFFFRNAERSDAREIYGQVAQAFTIVGCLAFLGILLYLDLIQYLLGEDLRQGLGIIPIMLLAYLFLGLFYNFSIWYKLQDRTMVGGLIGVGGMVITLILNTILVPQIGIYGPAWAALACYGFMAWLTYQSGQVNYKIDYPILKMVLYIAVVLCGYFLSDTGKQFYGDYLWIILSVNTLILGLCLLGFYYIDRSLFKKIILAFKNGLQRLRRRKS
ncbi:MAG TPA: oligosaccharide flippase family protein [Saprospiraceae bacterium]|nr:oligosaccharide flippase family protein [Saprospiraceae bacterium]